MSEETQEAKPTQPTSRTQNTEASKPSTKVIQMTGQDPLTERDLGKGFQGNSGNQGILLRPVGSHRTNPFISQTPSSTVDASPTSTTPPKPEGSSTSSTPKDVTE